MTNDSKFQLHCFIFGTIQETILHTHNKRERTAISASPKIKEKLQFLNKEIAGSERGLRGDDPISLEKTRLGSYLHFIMEGRHDMVDRHSKYVRYCICFGVQGRDLLFTSYTAREFSSSSVGWSPTDATGTHQVVRGLQVGFLPQEGFNGKEAGK